MSTAEPDGPDHLPRRQVKVLDTEISYVDTGSGEPLVFLHGNPAWSYQWRNIIPYISPHARCLAPDFVGMGWSSEVTTRLPALSDHARTWMHRSRHCGSEKRAWSCVIRGAPIGFYRARRNPGQIKAIASTRLWPYRAPLGGFTRQCARSHSTECCARLTASGWFSTRTCLSKSRPIRHTAKAQ